MAIGRQNTDELIEWCEKHGLDAREIPFEQPEQSLDRTGAIHYRFRQMVRPDPTAAPSRDAEGELRYEWVDVITRHKLPPLWVVG